MRDDPTIPQTFQQFRRIRREIAADPEPRTAMREGAILGVGVLLGGGFPGSAASVTMLLEHVFPEVREWPWEPVE